MTPSSSSAAVLYGPRDVRVEQRAIWPPAQGQAQVAVVSTGLCGSDLHYYTHGRNGDFAVRAPLVLGHEASGVITALGPGVTHLKVGQRVAIEAGISCRACSYCESGRYNLCKGMRFCSSAARFPHVDGTLQLRMNHPAFVLHPLPDDVPFDLASLAEPLSVLIHASRRANLCSTPAVYPHVSLSPFTSASTHTVQTSLSPSSSSQPPQYHRDTVLIFGVGAIGLLACALAKHRGARAVCAVDINPQRLQFALEQGFADAVYCLPAPSNAAAAAPAADPCCGVNRPSPSTQTAPAAPPTQDTLARAAAQSHTLLQHFAAALPQNNTNTNPAPSFNLADGFDLTLDCTGSESAIQMSVFCTSPGGRVMLIGMGTKSVMFPVSSAAVREVDVRGSFRYAGCYAEAVELLSAGSAPSPTPSDSDSTAKPTLRQLVSKLITHRFPLSDTKKAFEMLARGTDDQGGLVLKVMVDGEKP